MGKNKQFNKPKHAQKSAIATAKEQARANHKEYLTFSFKYLAEVGDKFSIKDENAPYFQTLVGRLRNLCSMTISEFYNTNSKAVRIHAIDWNDSRVTEDSFGMPNEDEIVEKPFQFQLTSNEHGRVHGFVIDNTFYVRWFDPKHLLYQ